MARPIKYKRPRKINAVSVTLGLILFVAGYLAYKLFPLFLLKQEAYRVLEEFGSAYAGRDNAYRADPKKVEELRRKMTAELRNIGIADPDLETWIEVDQREARFGAVYSAWVSWPFDVIEKQEHVYEIEHVVVDTTH